jgi:hypothetical protein
MHLSQHNIASLFVALTMGSSSRKRKQDSVSKKVKTKQPRSDLGNYRRKHPNDKASMIDRDMSTEDSDNGGGSGEDEDENGSTDDEQSPLKSKAPTLSARDKLKKRLKEGGGKNKEDTARDDEGGLYKDDSTLTDSQRTPVTARTGQLVTPATLPDAVGSCNRSLQLENTKLRRQLNGLCTVGVHEEVLATAVRKYVKVTLFQKVKFVTNQARLNLYMVQVMNYFHVEETDRLHWGQTYQHDVCDAINQKRNHVAQNLRKVFNSKYTGLCGPICVFGRFYHVADFTWFFVIL